MSEKLAFDSQKYFDAQIGRFREKLGVGDTQIIEFGGKPFGDYHASRVLPGYEPDLKAQILGSLCSELTDVKIVMAINSRDILSQPDGRRVAKRIRGDSGKAYDEEVLRLIEQANKEFNLPFETVVLTCTPDKLTSENLTGLKNYINRLKAEGLETHTLRQISGYPDISQESVVDELTGEEPITNSDNLIIVSPGGGSGKFGVAVTEIAHNLMVGKNPNFTKFETFPVFNLPTGHPLNMAFLAATADLPNALVELENGETNYDKDVENLALLKTLLTQFPEIDSPLKKFEVPTDMGVNVIESGILDEGLVAEACREEVELRMERYKKEHADGRESVDTIQRTRGYLGHMATLQTA